MPNYCNFDVYAIGKKEDIERLNKVMEADYSYGLTEEFLKKLKIYKEDSLIFTDNFACETVAEARRKARDLGDEWALEMLKDKNLKKEYFSNIPEEHFYRVFDYYPDENPEHLKDDIFIARSSGTCAWSVETCIIDSEGTGYYSDAKEEYPKHILTGTNLINFSKEVPDLKIAIISEEPAMEFSEFFTCVNGELGDDECEDYVEAWFDTIEEAATQGVEIEEDETDRFIYLKYPKWYEGDRKDLYIDEGYVFNRLGIEID